MQYPLLPLAAFLAAFLVLIPTPWHWRARNVATCAIIFWLFIVNMIYGVNSIIWANDVLNYAPVWCDISTKLVVGASFALPICTMCVCKHLEMVSSNRKVTFDHADKRRRIIFESVMCFGLPLIFLALHYVVQGHRFDIFQYIGCQATVYISVPAIMIVWFPPLFFSVLTLIFASVALYHFIRRRITFAVHLQNSNSALTTNRYLRLIAMAITEIIWGTVLTSLNLWNNVLGGLRPWTNWADVHSDFSRVAVFPAVLLPQRFVSMMMLLWSTMPISAFIFFIFFGFGEEAKKEYSKLLSWLRITILRKKDSEKISLFPVAGRNSYPKPLQLPTLGSLAITTADIDVDVEKAVPPPMYTASSNSSFPRTPAKRDEDSFSISTLSYYGTAIDSTPAVPQTAQRVKVGLASTPRPMYSNANANASTSSCPASLPLPRSSSNDIPVIIRISPAHSPSSSSDHINEHTTAPSSLSTKTSTFTLRTVNSIDRIYLSHNSRPQRVRTPTPAPFSDLQEIPSKGGRSSYSDPITESAASIRRPSVSGESENGGGERGGEGDGDGEVMDVPSFHRPFTPPSTYPVATPHTQRGLVDAIRVTVHTETRHGA